MINKNQNLTNLIVITFVAALGGLLFGFDIAIIAGAVPFIRDHFQLNELQLGWGVSSLLVGCVSQEHFHPRYSFSSYFLFLRRPVSFTKTAISRKLSRY